MKGLKGFMYALQSLGQSNISDFWDRLYRFQVINPHSFTEVQDFPQQKLPVIFNLGRLRNSVHLEM